MVEKPCKGFAVTVSRYGEDEFAAVASRVGQDIDKVRTQLTDGGHLPAMRSDISKRKALDWLTESVTITDEAGTPIAFADLAIVEDDDEALEATTDEAEDAAE